MREFYRRALVAGGYNPIDVRTAEEALDFLSLTPDLEVAVIDLNMPGRGGAWLIEQMRERFPGVAIILATADERVPGSLSLQPAVVSYLVKPISAARLLEAVGNALGARDDRAPAAADAAGDADPIESWLDKKLTHRHVDVGDRNK
jgi:response regulator NasT